MIWQAIKKFKLLFGNHFSAKTFTTSNQNYYKVAVIGSGGGIGQPLSLLLKLNPLVKQLILYDLRRAPGVAADLSHVVSACKVCGFSGEEQLGCALKNCNVVIISAGAPRQPGMSRTDLFEVNAKLIKSMAINISKYCPKAMVGIITNPLNTMVPLAARTLKNSGTYDPKRLFGLSGVDTNRAKVFVADVMNIDPREVDVSVIGGHSSETMIPVFSQCNPKVIGGQAEIQKLTRKVQQAGTEVLKAKAGFGSATLSVAYTAASFVCSILKALCGEKVTETVYVESCVTEAKFFSSQVILGKNGLENTLELPKLNDFEKKLLDTAIRELKKDIEAGYGEIQ